jgi:hypothetical protein
VNLVLQVSRPAAIESLAGLSSHRFVWGSSEGVDADALRRSLADGETLTEEEQKQTAVVGGNAQALQDGVYAKTFL